MFQRIREAIDSRIAEEQARQRTSQDVISRSNSARRPARNLSPGRRPTRPRRNTGTPVRTPDPNEFEPEFAIGDDDGSSRSVTPKLESAGGSERPLGKDAAEDKPSTDEPSAGKEVPTTEGNQLSSELPPEIRVKLRRLTKLESRYQELLKAYRMAHARVLSIEPFEAALRENTPLTSIADPKALTEYLNQITLKGDMVIEELKRVTTERDDYKKKLEEAQKSTKEACDAVADLKKDKTQGAKEEKTASTEDTASKKELPAKEESEEFFSFDNELPRLESELKEKQEEVETLKSQVESLKRDLAVARESTEGMVQNLESATRELVELRDIRDKQDSEIKKLKDTRQAEVDDVKAKLAESENTIAKAGEEAEKLKAELKQKTEEIEKLQDQVTQQKDNDQQKELQEKLEEVAKEKDASEKKLGVLQGLVDNLRSQLKDTEVVVSDLKADMKGKVEELGKLQNVVDYLNNNLKDNAEWQQTRDQAASGQSPDFDSLRKSLAPLQQEPGGGNLATEPEPPANGATGGAGASKKKKNKKKKGGKGGEDTAKATGAAVVQDKESHAAESDQAASDLADLEQKIQTLTKQLGDKEAAIDRLSSKLKGEEGLKEEIESLRDDLLHLGQDHVEAKDKIKELNVEKKALEETVSKLEKELADIRTSHASKSADSEKMHSDLKEDYENLKVKLTNLETELSAAQQLAATRFKDLTELRETLQKLQPELKSLRVESSELKSTKEALASKESELRTLEGKHEELRAEVKTLKSTISERDAEVKTLNQKIRQETDSRLKAEENLTVAQSDLRYSESKKQEAVETKEKIAADLSRAQDELKTARSQLREVENKVTQLNKELDGLREEIQLKTAQHASAQSLMNSMRDQSAELAMQMKEARERCESLEEELADAHRLLSERTREGETMRRLLSDIEGRAEAKVRDFKERMEAAIEERDRAEDEASAQGRRRARELEELKTKVREAEKALRTAEEDKEELERSQKDWKRRRDQLEEQSERSAQELNDIRQAMARLRDALDESEKQVRDLEKEKAELRRSVEETNSRLEKLRRSYRILSDETRAVQNPQSSRSSIDSGARKAVASPVSKDRSPSTRRSETPTGAPIDYIYLKNVLLQFLEQKDKNYQKQLIPVLGMLLHFDRTLDLTMSGEATIRLATPEGKFTPHSLQCFSARVGHRCEKVSRPLLTPCEIADVPYILQFIRELADYEKALHEVEATEESLLATLSFPNDTPKRGSVYTALVIPPATAENPSPVPVGMALFFYNYSTWRSAPGIYLEDLYVQPSARGKGYGFKLLKYLAAKVLEVKGRRLEWSVLKWNEPSIKFYKQVGAQAMEEWMKMMVEGPALNKLAEGL
ncbi:Golgin imh1 [Aspergillus fumigatus]